MISRLPVVVLYVEKGLIHIALLFKNRSLKFIYEILYIFDIRTAKYLNGTPVIWWLTSTFHASYSEKPLNALHLEFISYCDEVLHEDGEGT